MEGLEERFRKVRQASRELVAISTEQVNVVLKDLAALAVERIPQLLLENKKDLDRMDKTDPKYDRLLLSEDRIKAIADDILNVSELVSPVGEVLS